MWLRRSSAWRIWWTSGSQDVRGWEDAGPVDDWLVVSNYFYYFHPDPWGKMNPFFDSYFFKWAETTN